MLTSAAGWMDVMQWVGAAAFALVGGLTELVRRIAMWLALTDHPDVRKSHEHPTPYLGGVVIVIGVLLPSVLVMSGGDGRLRTLILAAAAVALLGLADDLRPLSPAPRLIVEGLAATAVVVVDGRVHLFGNLLDYLLPVLWIVVITNSFNLLDNMDGAAAGVASVTGAALSISAFHGGPAEHRAAAPGARLRMRRLPPAQLDPGAHLHGRRRLALHRVRDLGVRAFSSARAPVSRRPSPGR